MPCILVSGYLQAKRLKRLEKENSLSNSDWNWTQLKLQFYTENWWGNCTRNCISRSSCWQEHHFLHSHKWFKGPTRTAASKATIHYSVKCFIHFHHAMKWTEQRAMDHDGASTAELQNEKFLILPHLPNPPWPGFPCPKHILKKSQHEHYSWSLEQTRRVLSHSKSNATIRQEMLLMQTLPRGEAMWQLLWLYQCGQKTHHIAVTLFHCSHSAAPVTTNSCVSFICHRKHRAPGTAPTTPGFYWTHLP